MGLFLYMIDMNLIDCPSWLLVKNSVQRERLLCAVGPGGSSCHYSMAHVLFPTILYRFSMYSASAVLDDGLMLPPRVFLLHDDKIKSKTRDYCQSV